VSKEVEHKRTYDISDIQKVIPHRYPFLLIDKVIDHIDNDRIVAIKNVTMNEQFFQGHFPGKPVMPGVLVLEAMAQACALLSVWSTDGVPPGSVLYLVGATDVKWKRQVVPGDTLRIEMKFVKKRRPLWMLAGEATVEGQLAASASISAYEGEPIDPKGA